MAIEDRAVLTPNPPKDMTNKIQFKKLSGGEMIEIDESWFKFQDHMPFNQYDFDEATIKAISNQLYAQMMGWA